MKAEFARTLSDGKAGFPELLEAIEGYLEQHGVAPGAVAQLMIAFDEIISNVLNHGGDRHSPIVEVRVSVGDCSVSAEVADNGKPFDPLAAPPPDTNLPVEERPIGGLGIHLVREMMDEVSYLREQGGNRLRFYKTYSVG